MSDAELNPVAQSIAATQPMTPTQALSRGFDLDPEASLDIIQTSAASNKQTTAKLDQQSRQGFRIGDLRLMISYHDASELTDLPQTFRLPNAPAWFRGMANLHGALIPVFDLTRYLGVDAEPQTKPMLLVLSRGVDAAGVIIDGTPERLRWGAEQMADAATVANELESFVKTAVVIDEHLWFDLDVTALLDALEQSLGNPK